jgi:hypothetical protein
MPVLRATAHTDKSPAGGVDITALPALQLILIDNASRQHLVLRAHGVILQVVVDGAEVVHGPVVLGFHIDSQLRRSGHQLIMMDRILSGTAPRSPPKPVWTPQARKLRNAVIALDGRAAGASHREVAIAIYGQAKVASEWGPAGLRDVVRRDLERGLKLAAGSYRHLLRQGW